MFPGVRKLGQLDATFVIFNSEENKSPNKQIEVLNPQMDLCPSFESGRGRVSNGRLATVSGFSFRTDLIESVI